MTMWKIKASVGLGLAAIGFLVAVIASDKSLADMGKTVAFIGAALAAWIAFKGIVFGVDQDD
jgi:hypothetical protein